MGPVRWIAAVALLVLVLLAGRWVAARAPGDRRFVVALALAALTLVPNERDAGIVVGVLAMACVYLAALRPLASWLDRRASMAGAVVWRGARRARVALLRMPASRFGLVVFGAMFVASSLVSWALFRGIPVIQDSQAQLFHARIFASGAISGVPPPEAIAEFFEAEHVIVRGGLYSQYPPGHTVLLALGVLAGAPWAVNPALGGLALVLIWRVGRALWNDQTGRRAALLGLVSPFLLFMSSEYMNHATMLVLFALQVLATVRALRCSSRGSAMAWAALAGAMVGWQALVRPLSAVGLAAPLGVLVLWHALREPRRHALPMLAMAASACAVASLLFVFNTATTGSPLLMGYTVRWGPQHTIGFGVAPWGPVHTPLRGVEQTLSNLDAWNLFLFGGPLPASVLVALGITRDRRRPVIWALTASPLAVLALYFFYFGQDLTFGPRYLYEASLLALLATSRAVGWLPVLLRRAAVVSRRAIARGFVGRAIGLGVVFAYLFFVPGIAWEYANRYALHGGAVDRAQREIDGEAIVFVEGSYQKVFYAMEPTFSSRILFAQDLGDARDRELACWFPGRSLWVHRDGRLAPLEARCDRDRDRGVTSRAR